MKLIYLVLEERELEFIGTDENYEILRTEYIKYMSTGKQDVFWFSFPNNAELLLSFTELVAIYAEESNEDFEEDYDIENEESTEEARV